MITTEWMRQNLQNDLNRLTVQQAERAAAAAFLGGVIGPNGRPMVSQEGAEGSALLMLADSFRDAICQRLLNHCRAGRRGWDNPEYPKEQLLARLWSNATRGDWVDVAALAMILHNRTSGWGNGVVREDNAKPKAKKEINA